MKNKQNIKESPLFWPASLKPDALYVLDETLIPKKIHYIKVKSAKEAIDVIRQMKTRAFGQFLVVLNAFLLELRQFKKESPEAILKKIQATAEGLNNSRPTFPFSEVTSIVIYWAKEAIDGKKDVISYVVRNIEGYLGAIRARRLDRVERIAAVMKDGDSVLTHCNVSGELAMASAIAKSQGKTLYFG